MGIITVIPISVFFTVDNAYAMHTDDGAHTTPFRYPPPLKQLNAGTPIQDIQCNEGKFLIYKRVTLSPACVSDKASNDLIFPPYGWAKLRIGMPAETITQQKMCLWYPDVKLVQQSCSGFDLIEFEKYYLMNCVDLAKDAIDETSEYSNNDIRNYVSDRLTTCTIQEEGEINSDSCDQLYDRFTKGGPYLYEKFKNLAENKLRNCVDYKDLNDYEMRSPGFILHENPLYVIPESCTDDMIKHLIKYSNMFSDDELFMLEWVSLPSTVNEKHFDVCVEELLELRSNRK